MKHDLRAPLRLFLVTGPLPCPYLPGRLERRLVVELGGHDVVAFHDGLSAAGFRRSHGIAYAPVCSGCDACTPVRIDVPGFAPGRNLKRILRRNRDLDVALRPPRATAEQFRLFSAYQRGRHGGGEMAKMTFADYQALIEETPLDTVVVEARDPSDRLVAVGLMDRLGDGLSAVYSFFDCAEPARSLGTFLILWSVGWARREGLSHVYLGYWIAGASKMAYKSRFRPLEAYRDGRWSRLPDAPAARR